VVSVDDLHVAAMRAFLSTIDFLDRRVCADAKGTFPVSKAFMRSAGTRNSLNPSIIALSISNPSRCASEWPMTERLTVHSLRIQPSPDIDSTTCESSSL
jgi:hypothetical protein